MRSLIIFVVLLLTSSVSVADADLSGPAPGGELELRKQLVGHWQVSVPMPDGGFREEFTTIVKNGTFKLRHVLYNKTGSIVEAYVITGVWGLAEDIFFTTNVKYRYKNDVIYRAYLGDAHEFAAYRVLEINGDFKRFQGLGDDQPMRLKRVAVDPCEGAVGGGCV